MKKHQNLFRDLQEDFRKMKKNLLVAQSGGPTAAINATLAGVIKQAIKEEQIDQVYGACYGIQGVLEQKFVNLTEKVERELRRQRLVLVVLSLMISRKMTVSIRRLLIFFIR